MDEATQKYRKGNLLLRPDTQNFNSMLSVLKEMIVLQLYIAQRYIQKNTWLTI